VSAAADLLVGWLVEQRGGRLLLTSGV